ncbi:MAG TPA: MotA/TolQ/ExbB proton channel family protein [Spirochaetota bacterium]|nr:MotA/TolQ/ExbB proton channel family protein [Spirochaetota bacterium]
MDLVDWLMESGIILNLLISIPTWIMLLPIGLCSLLLLAVFIERMWSYRNYSGTMALSVSSAVMLFNGGQVKDAIAVLKKDTSSISQIFLTMVEVKSVKEREKLVDESVHVLASKIERFTGLISTISTVSPMFGLLGTVTGMMKSFSALAKTSQQAQTLLASGIAEALVTTATGLLVAIPAVVFYNYMVSRSSVLLKNIEIALNSIMDDGK